MQVRCESRAVIDASVGRDGVCAQHHGALLMDDSTCGPFRESTKREPRACMNSARAIALFLLSTVAAHTDVPHSVRFACHTGARSPLEAQPRPCGCPRRVVAEAEGPCCLASCASRLGEFASHRRRRWHSSCARCRPRRCKRAETGAPAPAPRPRRDGPPVVVRVPAPAPRRQQVQARPPPHGGQDARDRPPWHSRWRRVVGRDARRGVGADGLRRPALCAGGVPAPPGGWRRAAHDCASRGAVSEPR